MISFDELMLERRLEKARERACRSAQILDGVEPPVAPARPEPVNSARTALCRQTTPRLTSVAAATVTGVLLRVLFGTVGVATAVTVWSSMLEF